MIFNLASILSGVKKIASEVDWHAEAIFTFSRLIYLRLFFANVLKWTK